MGRHGKGRTLMIQEHPGPPAELTLRILDVLAETAECEMEQLVTRCAPYTWNAVFLEVDRLSRSGQICLSYRVGGTYAASLRRAA